MSDIDTRKLAAALAAEVNARQSADYEARPAKDGYADALLARKKGEGRSAGLIVRRAAPDAAGSAAASALAAKLAAKLGEKSGALTLLAPRPPAAADAEAWSAAAAEVIAALEKAGTKTGSDLMTLDDPPAGSPFDYASWTPLAKGGLKVDVFFRSGAARAKPKASDAEDHWLVLLGEPAPAGKACGRAFALDLQGDAVCRAWWAEPKGSGFAFRRF
ncbi:MAG TPA: hypothetical protein VH309_11905 [Elusimicrobiota bacterium]|jgi:hypothetical protein|nr:hypothetical protein [Elusimicrobiota bacterium]